jgi:hypothetical protein
VCGSLDILKTTPRYSFRSFAHSMTTADPRGTSDPAAGRWAVTIHTPGQVRAPSGGPSTSAEVTTTPLLWPTLRASCTVMAVRSGTVTRAALEYSASMSLTLRLNEKRAKGLAVAGVPRGVLSHSRRKQRSIPASGSSFPTGTPRSSRHPGRWTASRSSPRTWATVRTTQASGSPTHSADLSADPSGLTMAFWTLTSLPRQPVGRADMLRSTPSMLNPWSSSNGENSPATPSMRSARRFVSELPAMGRMSISTDLVASAGSWSSRKVPRMDWEPATITLRLPMIWRAVRMACSSWSRLSSLPLGVRPASRRGGVARPWAIPRASRWSRGRARSGPGAGRARHRP